MKSKIENSNGCMRTVDIELSAQEVSQELDQVFVAIRKVARVPGFRPGSAPRDLLETYYGKKAEEELIKRAVPEYYLRAVKQEKLLPVAAPEIENVQFKDHILFFRAKVEVKPEIKIKNYKKLSLVKKKINVGEDQISQALQRLRESKAKQAEAKDHQQKNLPELNDDFAQSLSSNTLQELKEAIGKNLVANAEVELQLDLQRQIVDELLQKASLDVPRSWVDSQTEELLKQLQWDCALRGESKLDIESKKEQLQDEARKEAVRRVKLSFILGEIAQLENISVSEEDLEHKINEIAQRTGKGNDELRQYLESQNLIFSLKQELQDKKTMDFLLQEAKIEQPTG